MTDYGAWSPLHPPRGPRGVRTHPSELASLRADGAAQGHVRDQADHRGLDDAIGLGCPNSLGRTKISADLTLALQLARRDIVEAMTYDELLTAARSCEGRTLRTVTGKKFRVGVYLDCPFFTPASSGRGQSDGRPAAERFVARFNEIGSLRPGDYSTVTRNASYFIGLILAVDPSLGDTLSVDRRP
jgi:hypothetical protein